MPNIENRTCGGCTACCYTHAVPAVSTPVGKNCDHCIVGNGCSIYNTRPEACSTYKCWWLKGLLEIEAARPDKIGFVVDSWDIQDESLKCLNMWEFTPGSIKSKTGQLFLQAVLGMGTFAVLCITPSEDGLEPHFPEGTSEAVQERFIANVARFIDADGKI